MGEPEFYAGTFLETGMSLLSGPQRHLRLKEKTKQNQSTIHTFISFLHSSLESRLLETVAQTQTGCRETEFLLEEA